MLSSFLLNGGWETPRQVICDADYISVVAGPCPRALTKPECVRPFARVCGFFLTCRHANRAIGQKVIGRHAHIFFGAKDHEKELSLNKFLRGSGVCTCCVCVSVSACLMSVLVLLRSPASGHCVHSSVLARRCCIKLGLVELFPMLLHDTFH